MKTTDLRTGYETTANAMLSSTLVLVMEKHIQTRVLQEIDSVYAAAAQEGRSSLSYTHDFPRFRYLTAFMVRSCPL